MVYGATDVKLSGTVEKAGTNGVWTWGSENTEVVEIDANGNVTIKKVGSSKITATYESDGTVGTASIILTVKKSDSQKEPDVSKFTVTNPGTMTSTNGQISSSELVAASMEYSRNDGTTWADISAFPLTGLSAGKYLFRYKENDNEVAGKSLCIVLEPVNMLSGVVLFGSTVYESGKTNTLTAVTNSNVDGLTLSYKWYRDGAQIEGATGNTYTLTSSDVGKTIKVVVTEGTASVSSMLPQKITAVAPAGYKVSGTVTNHGGTAAADISVELKKGDYVADKVQSGADGTYSFEKVPAGLYNVVAVADGKMKTALAEVINGNITVNIQMPEKKVSSQITVKENDEENGLAGAAVVGGLDQVAEAEASSNADGTSTEVTMTVESVNDLTSDTGTLTTEQQVMKTEQTAIKDEIQANHKNDGIKKLDFLDFSIMMKTVTGTGANRVIKQDAITETGTHVLEIVLPYQTTGKKVLVFRKHGDEAAAALTSYPTRPSDRVCQG